MKKYDRICAGVLILLSVASAYYAYTHLKLGTLREPDAGLLPLLASLVVAGGSGVWLFELRGPDDALRSFWPKGAWLRPLLALVFLLLYAVTMEELGYLLSTFIFLGLWQFVLERVNWRRGMLVTVLGTASVYILFVQILGVHVPKSIFGL